MTTIRYQRGSTENFVLAGEPLGRGGEASVYLYPNDPQLVVKVYHRPTGDHEAKVDNMLRNPPDDAPAGGNPNIAWPVDAVYSVAGSRRKFAGYVMPLIKGTHDGQPLLAVSEYYTPKPRLRSNPLFHYGYLHRTARNLAAAVAAVHKKGYVIGDLNEENIRVEQTALVTLIDTDSFQVRDAATGVVHRCPVGKPEFTPPELQGLNFRDVDRVIEHDLFGLAVITFYLLMEGYHPFYGCVPPQQTPPSFPERIAAGSFPYALTHHPEWGPKSSVPPFANLHPRIQMLMTRCFVNGHRQPKDRPTADEWRDALEEAESDLQACPVNDQHFFGRHVSSCPWCLHARQFSDTFPSKDSVRQNLHLRKRAPAQKPMPAPARPPAQPNVAAVQRRIAGTTLLSNKPVWTSAPPAKRKFGKAGRVLAVVASGFLVLLVARLFFGGQHPARYEQPRDTPSHQPSDDTPVHQQTSDTPARPHRADSPAEPYNAFFYTPTPTPWMYQDKARTPVPDSNAQKRKALAHAQQSDVDLNKAYDDLRDRLNSSDRASWKKLQNEWLRMRSGRTGGPELLTRGMSADVEDMRRYAEWNEARTTELRKVPRSSR